MYYVGSDCIPCTVSDLNLLAPTDCRAWSSGHDHDSGSLYPKSLPACTFSFSRSRMLLPAPAGAAYLWRQSPTEPNDIDKSSNPQVSLLLDLAGFLFWAHLYCGEAHHLNTGPRATTTFPVTIE